MKVTGYGTVRPTSSTRKKDTASNVSFADLLSAAEAGDSGLTVESAAETKSIGNLLALQEISEEEKRRRQMFRQGEDMLNEMEKLRQQLLIGAIPSSMLASLSDKLNIQKQVVSDEQLRVLIEDIELRLAVELAKLEVAFASRSEL